MGLEVKPSAKQGFLPFNYVGGESVTYPNGLIEKSGYLARTGLDTTVTFATPFPNDCISAVAIAVFDGALDYEVHLKARPTVNSFIITESDVPPGFCWFAKGW